MEIRRGYLVTIAVSGDYGKPRPALVVQSDIFIEYPSITVLRLTTELHDAPALRILVHPSKNTGLKQPSQVMVDKAVTVPRDKIRQCIGSIDNETLRAVNRALAIFLGL